MKEKKREESERKILRGEKHRTRPIIFSDKRNDEDEKKKKNDRGKRKRKANVFVNRGSQSLLSHQECLASPSV